MNRPNIRLAPIRLLLAITVCLLTPIAFVLAQTDKQAEAPASDGPTSKLATTAITRYDKAMTKATSERDRALKAAKDNLLRGLQSAKIAAEKRGDQQEVELIELTLKKIKGEAGQADIQKLKDEIEAKTQEIQKLEQLVKEAVKKNRNAAAQNLLDKQSLAEKQLSQLRRQLSSAQTLQGDAYDPTTAPLQSAAGKSTLTRYKREMSQLTKKYEGLTQAATSIRNKFLDNAMKLAARKKDTREVEAIKAYLSQSKTSAPDPDAPGSGANWNDLLDGVDLSKHGMSSSWKIEDGVLINTSVGIGRYRASVLPEGQYDVFVQFTALHANKGSFYVALPLSSQEAVMFTVGTGKDEKSGFSNINQKPAQQNGQGVQNKVVVNQKMSLHIKVRRPFKNVLTIHTKLDGENYVFYQGPQHVLSQPAYWSINKPYSLGVSARNRCVKIHAFKWAPIGK